MSLIHQLWRLSEILLRVLMIVMLMCVLVMLVLVIRTVSGDCSFPFLVKI